MRIGGLADDLCVFEFRGIGDVDRNINAVVHGVHERLYVDRNVDSRLTCGLPDIRHRPCPRATLVQLRQCHDLFVEVRIGKTGSVPCPEVVLARMKQV